MSLLSFVVGCVVGAFAMHLMAGLPVVEAALNTVMVPVQFVVSALKKAWTAVMGLFSKSA
jgi:hypothetical protein